MINQHLIEPFARSYRSFDGGGHTITDEVVLRPTLRQRFGLRLIDLGHHLTGPADESRLAA
jgi:hypothetical protein